MANVGPGFDVFGFALDAPTDVIYATKLEGEPKKVIIINKNNKTLPTNPAKNTAGVAAAYILDKINAEFGIELIIEKGMRIGTGLGSSAASAAAGAKAVEYFSENNIPIQILLEAVIKAEETIDGGIHGDNAVSSLLGGFILIPSSRNPLIYSKFDLPSNLRVVLATPPISILTSEARRGIPKQIPFHHSVKSIGYAGLVIAGIVKKDLKLMGQGLIDPIIEPIRAKMMIDEGADFYAVKKAALNAGAFGCSISGAGPTVFAIADQNSNLRQIGKAMAEAFGDFPDPIIVRIGLPNNNGAKILARSYEF